MKLSYFNQLDEIDQFEAVWLYGVKLGERFEGDKKVILYQISSFYIEVFLNRDGVLSHLLSFHNYD